MLLFFCFFVCKVVIFFEKKLEKSLKSAKFAVEF